MQTEFWSDQRLQHLTPVEIESLDGLPEVQVISLINYMLGNGFFGMDFDHVPAELEPAFSAYRSRYARLSLNSNGIGN